MPSLLCISIYCYINGDIIIARHLLPQIDIVRLWEPTAANKQDINVINDLIDIC